MRLGLVEPNDPLLDELLPPVTGVNLLARIDGTTQSRRMHTSASLPLSVMSMHGLVHRLTGRRASLLNSLSLRWM